MRLGFPSTFQGMMLKVPIVWMGMLGVAASGFAIWKTPRLLAIDAGDDGKGFS